MQNKLTNNSLATPAPAVDTVRMKRTLDIDEEALAGAEAILRFGNVDETVNECLRYVAENLAERSAQVDKAIEVLSKVELSDEERRRAWR